jgi:hypothetical protein
MVFSYTLDVHYFHERQRSACRKLRIEGTATTLNTRRMPSSGMALVRITYRLHHQGDKNNNSSQRASVVSYC